MQTWKRALNFALALSLFVAGTTAHSFAQTAKHITASGQTKVVATTAASTDLSASLATIERALDAKRVELGVQGASLVIVKDDRVIYIKGLGDKDAERKRAVTPDTLFAIGSSSKAFTAMVVAMSVDDGKLSLDDAPKKFLPYFKLQDPDADARITLRDLLDHSSGLNRTDLAWITGVLNREETIRVAALAKPTAKLREKFQYQNVMYAAAGEIAAKANGTTWDKLVTERILKPLGMRATTLNVRDTERAPDYALGYDYDEDAKLPLRRPMRDFPQVAPAGAINSNARDMAQWLRLMLGGGVFEGKRLVSEKNFNELLSPQTKIGGSISYGLGWFLRDWHGHKIAEHGGNIDGFTAQVALMPDQHLGFALLTNANNSPLGATAMEAVWSNLVGTPGAMDKNAAPAESAADMARETGSYLLAEANATMEVSLKEGKFSFSVPGQPVYPLENVGGRRYKLAEPAPAGFYVTFRPVKDNEKETEIYLEQPQGNYILKKIKPADATTASVSGASSEYTGPLKEVIGSYESEKEGPAIEFALRDGKVALVVPGQPPYQLVEKSKDVLASPMLPDAYSILLRRDEAGKLSGIVLKQPEGEFAFRRTVEFKPAFTVDELMAKVVAALGGEANLRRHKTVLTTADVSFEQQGVTGDAVSYARAPASAATNLTLMALGKKIGSVHEFFDGAAGGAEASFLAFKPETGKGLADARVASDFYEPLNWKLLFKSVEIMRMTKIGGEDVYVVVKTPEKGSRVTDYISTKTFLLVRRDGFETDGSYSEPVTTKYSDYRLVDGVMIPFTLVSNSPSNGDTVSHVKEVKFDAPVPDAVFRRQELKK